MQTVCGSRATPRGISIELADRYCSSNASPLPPLPPIPTCQSSSINKNHCFSFRWLYIFILHALLLSCFIILLLLFLGQYTEWKDNSLVLTWRIKESTATYFAEKQTQELKQAMSSTEMEDRMKMMIAQRDHSLPVAHLTPHKGPITEVLSWESRRGSAFIHNIVMVNHEKRVQINRMGIYRVYAQISLRCKGGKEAINVYLHRHHHTNKTTFHQQELIHSSSPPCAVKGPSSVSPITLTWHV
uniref:THD domain-containing protein n=1 Tax=Eptatretus burgeri TaxID=7764 RepID=A0A8C4NA27_EPTBU